MDFKSFLREQSDSLRRMAGGSNLGTLVAGAVLGWVASALSRRFAPEGSEWETISDGDGDADGADDVIEEYDTGEESKLILCVRTDLGMSKGKIAAQAGHATLGAYNTAKRKSPALVRRWERDAQPKIALAIKSAGEAKELERRARAASLPTYVVHDAGRTQIAAVSCECRNEQPFTDIYEIGELDGARRRPRAQVANRHGHGASPIIVILRVAENCQHEAR